jgi:hypothetical protein
MVLKMSYPLSHTVVNKKKKKKGKEKKNNRNIYDVPIYTCG